MKLFAIFGNPVSHSKSPLMHNLAFKKLDFDGCYVRWKLEDGSKLRDTFYNLKLTGCNITVPYKEEAFKVADIVEPFAAKVQAVNTLILKDEKLYGYNTDAPGFYRTLQKFGSIKSALIMGAGGTARALALYLRLKNIDIEVVNRSAKRLEWFENEGFICHTWNSFNPSTKDVIINTTSAGLTDNSLPMPKELLDRVFKDTKYVVDVIYGKETPFSKEAKTLALPFFDGSQMLLQQGIIAFDYFTQHRYSLDNIEATMRSFLYL